MKAILKTIPKKALSLVIALAVILCSFGATLLTFAESGEPVAEPYKVSFRSPAIPMFRDKVVDLKNIQVQLTEGGQYISGSELTWAVADESSVEYLNVNAKTFTALETGTYKLTATKGNITKNVYVMVNEPTGEVTDYDFYLLNVTANQATYNADPSKWVYASQTTTTTSNWAGNPNIKTGYTSFYKSELGNPILTNDTSSKVNAGNIYVASYYYGLMLYYVDPILSDFADYSFSTNVKNTDGNDHFSSQGFILRANINPNVAKYDANAETNQSIFVLDGETKETATGTGLYFLNNNNGGGVMVGGIGKDFFSTGGAGNLKNGLPSVSYHTLTDYTVLARKTPFNPQYVFTSTNSYNSIARNISIDVVGNKVNYSIDNQPILDTINNDTVYKLVDAQWSDRGTVTNSEFDFATAFDNNGVSKAGNAIGFYTSSMCMTINSFSVKLAGVTADNMPATTDVDLNEIADGAKLNTTVGTTIDLGGYYYALGSGVLGNAVTFTVDGEDIGTTFTVEKAGVYTVTATYGEESLTLYIYAPKSAAKFYEVTDRSPAIPMFVNTKLDLGNITVQLEDGSVYCGSDLDWSFVNPEDDNDSIRINNSAKTIAAYTAGTYKLFASKGEVKNTVYVMVNEPTGEVTDYDFYLVNVTANKTTYEADPSKWVYALNSSAAYVNPSTSHTSFSEYDITKTTTPFTHYSSFQASYVQIRANSTNALLFYVDPILSDFADYSFSTRAVAYNTSDQNISRGFVLRANINPDATGKSIFALNDETNATATGTGLYFSHFNCGGVGMGVYGKSAPVAGGIRNGAASTALHTLGTGTDLAASLTGKNANVNTSYLFTEAITTARNISIDVIGSNVKYTLGDQTILDTFNNNTVYTLGGAFWNAGSAGTIAEFDYATNFAEKGLTAAGNAIGFTSGHCGVRIYSFSVKLAGVSENNFPAATAVEPFEYYEVTDGSPALPMFANTKIDLADIKVELEDGTVAIGNKLTWSDEDYEGVEVKDGFVYATAAGTYKFTVTNGTAQNTVYVMVNNTGDLNFNILNVVANKATYDSDPGKWVYATRENGTLNSFPKLNTTGYYKSDIYSPLYSDANAEGERTYLSNNYIVMQSNNFSNMLFYVDPILSDFADYSFSATISVPWTCDNLGSKGFILRANINPDVEKYDTVNQVGDSIFKLPGDTDTASGTGLYFMSNDNGAGVSVGGIGKSYFATGGNAWRLGVGGVTYHTLPDYTKLVYETRDINYTLASFKNGFKEVAIDVVGNDVKYSLAGNTILDTFGGNQVYKLINGHRTTGDGTKPSNATFDFASAFAEKGVSTAGNAIGFNIAAASMYISSFTVKLAGIDSVEDLPDATFYLATKQIPANTRFNLSTLTLMVGEDIISGADVSWKTHRGADYEIANGYLLAYSVAGEMTVRGTYNGETVEVPVNLIDKGATAAGVEKFAEEYMTVTPLVDGYTVTINEDANTALAYGTLTLKADYVDAVRLLNADSTGKTYAFSVLYPETMVIAATKATDLETRENSIYPLGAQVNVERSAIRFVARYPQIKNNGSDITLATGYKQVGVIVIPKILIVDANWKDSVSAEDLAIAEDVETTEVNIGATRNASNVAIRKLMSANEAFADASAMLTNIPDSMYAVDIVAVPYLITNDDMVVFYNGDMPTDNYNNVYNKAYPTTSTSGGSGIDPYVFGGTDHDIDNDASTNSLSYGLNEDITFIYYLKGAYTLEWQLDKDDASENDESVISGTKVAAGTFDPATDGSVFKVTTRMQKAGVVQLTVNVKKGDTLVTTFRASAAADYANIQASLLELNDYTVETLTAERASYFDPWKIDWNDQVSSIDTAGAEAWLATNPEKDAEYTDSAIKLVVVEKNATYTAYSFRIATDATNGINTETNSDVASVNTRPATGVFSIPNSADEDSLDIYAQFCGAGSNTVATTSVANKLAVRVLNNGLDNGTEKNDFIFENAIEGATPEASYQYGMLRRDYIALQVAKKLFANVLKDDLAIQTTGGSMGGWQAVQMAALDDDVNLIDTSSITWQCSVGSSEAGDIAPLSTISPKVNTTVARVFSTITAAYSINARLSENSDALTVRIAGGFGDTVCPPNGLIALYNAFTDSDITKSIVLEQHREHNSYKGGTNNSFSSRIGN